MSTSSRNGKGTRLLPHSDPLTDVLDATRLRCMVPGAHEMTAPWGIRFDVVKHEDIRRHAASLGLSLPPKKLPPPRGTIIAVTRGHCWLEVEEYKLEQPLAGGDVVLLNRQTKFVLRDTPQTHAKPLHDLIRREHIEHLRGLTHGGGGVPTTFLCGGFFFEDEADNPLMRSLPPVIHLRSSQTEVVPWLEGTLKFLTHELTARGPGSQSVIDHLAHVLFVQAVRAHAAGLPEDQSGNWFQALMDSELAPAMGAIHSRPEEPWTVARLAEESNCSRSAFAARFTAAVGCPPLQYVTECRMRRARRLLRETDLAVKAVAMKVGYANETAFSHAFRRLTGLSPGRYRQAADDSCPT